MVIFFGPAGSGKSTQGKIIAEKYGGAWLSIGELLRRSAESRPELAEILKAGELVNSELVMKAIGEAIAAAEGAFVILDGFPRDMWQAEYLRDHGALHYIEGALVLDGDREELMGRLSSRGREDDVRDVIEERFKLFDSAMEDVLPMMEDEGVEIVTVNCIGSVEKVTERIEVQLKRWGIIK